jgi:hypothetical protein
VLDTDSDVDGVPDCIDQCPNDPNKTVPGTCGCGVADTDTDSDGTPDCIDQCPNDPDKTVPGTCGCGVTDADSDNDGVADCNDNCPSTPSGESVDSSGCDIDAPTPDPMVFSSNPSAGGTGSISMTAATAADGNGVQYYFEETTGNSGGTDSGWQDSASYTDTGLSASTQYAYRVKARDKSANNNETGWSSAQTATTDDPPKSGCGAAPMGRNGIDPVSARKSMGKAALPLAPSILALGIWSLINRKKSREA